MDVLGTMRVNDEDTGEMLAKVEAVFTCDECENMDEFVYEHGKDIEEYLQNQVSGELDGVKAVVRFDLTELTDEDEEDGE